MSIIKCQDCGKKYSDRLDHCPFCRPGGISHRDQVSKFTLYVLLAIAIISFGIFYVNNYLAGKKANERAEIVRIEAKKVQQQKKAQLRKEKRSAEKLAKKAQMTPAQIRKKRIEKVFSPWDGSHRNLERLVIKTMNDPDSYKHAETTYWDKGAYLIVKTVFRGKNAFGGTVKNWVKVKTDLDGNIVAVIDQGY